MRAEVVSIGTELLLGEIDDTNATFIARALRDIGIDLIFRTTVGDNRERIAHIIDTALSRVDIVITSGGLGPTVDDVTREGIADATGRPLVFSELMMSWIAARFEKLAVRRMSENNRRQAYLPEGAIPVENPVGTAPIFILETERGVVITLPGVPREMTYLMEHSIVPWLQEHTDAPAVIKSRILRAAGLGESTIDDRIADLMTLSNPTVGLAAHTGQVDIRIAAKASTEAAALEMIGPVAEEVRRRLGSWIYGENEDSLEDIVLHMLAERRQTLAALEIGPTHLLVERLTHAREVVPDTIIETVQMQEVGELVSLGVDVSDAVVSMAELAAQALRQQTGCSIGVAVVTATLSSGEHSAAVAVAHETLCHSREYPWLTGRSDASIWIANHALAMVRRCMLELSEGWNASGD